MPARRPTSFYWRRAFLVLASVTGVVQATLPLGPVVEGVLDNPLPAEMAWVAGIVLGATLLLMPFFVVAIITFQKINPFVDDVWERPAASSNPLYLANPLFPIDFVGKGVVAWGLGYVACAPWSGLAALLVGTVGIIVGLDFLLAVRWAIRDTCRERVVAAYVEDYNHRRLHSALGYVTPADKLNGLEQVIFAERDRKLEQARQRRQQARQAGHQAA